MVEKFLNCEKKLLNSIHKKEYSEAVNTLKEYTKKYKTISKQYIVNRFVEDNGLSREYSLLIVNKFLKFLNTPLSSEVKRIKLRGVDKNNLKPIITMAYKHNSNAINGIECYIYSSRIQYKAQKNRYKVKTFNFIDIF